MYYILLALLTENHGYGIMQTVEKLTDGRVVIGAGTLYSLLGRFEKEGFIEQTAERERRKIYVITESGRKILQEEYNRGNPGKSTQLVGADLQEVLHPLRRRFHLQPFP